MGTGLGSATPTREARSANLRSARRGSARRVPQRRPEDDVGQTAWGRTRGGRIGLMNQGEIEAEVLKPHSQVRARLARNLLESLEAFSEEENERLWVEEADRRDRDWGSTHASARLAPDVLRDARAKPR